MGTRLHPITAAIALALGTIPLSPVVIAADLNNTHGDEVVVTSTVLQGEPKANTQTDDTLSLSPEEIRSLQVTTSDSAVLLSDIPGVNLYTAGGVSSLPSIHGLADDRLRTKVDGMDLIASCPNHMNSPLSYIDPAQVGSIQVLSGVAPVSVSGDSIGGSILVKSAEPVFAAPGQGSLTKGEVGASYRSNGNAHSEHLSATYATESFNITYTGANAQADNYKAGGNFKKFPLSAGVNGSNVYHPTDAPNLPIVAADEVGSTAYETRNQTLGLAYKNGQHLFEAKIGLQDLPEQLYPNQRMDMLGNDATSVNLRYLGELSWGSLEARAYHQTVDHYMDFGADKLYNYGALKDAITGIGNVYPVNGMPMYTASETNGVSVKGDINLNPRDLLRVGAEAQTYRLDDWWPPAPDCGYTGATANCTGGMAPDTFWNIRDGKRDRLAAFGEWEAQWKPEWKTIAGLRVEQVTSDSGDIQGYNTGFMYANSVVGTRQNWNDLDRKHTDNNIDVTLLARNTPDAQHSFEYGIAQKTRSPNLYERYPWSTNSMAMEMNNFVGDGNGYVGNPYLKPEVARTLSLTGDWHSADREYELKLTPYYTEVQDYIDAVRRPTSGTDQNATRTTGFVKLTYANQSARIYGIDISGRMPLAKNDLGAFGLKGLINYTDGENTDTNDGLYNIMPLNAKLTLTHKLGDWGNAIEIVGVTGKDDVSDVRNEIKTPGYGLVHLRGSYTMKKVRFDFGVENLLDHQYYLPLGGAYVGEGATMSFNNEAGTVRYANAAANASYGTSGSESMWGTAVPGPGRSLYAGVSYDF